MKARDLCATVETGIILACEDAVGFALYVVRLGLISWLLKLPVQTVPVDPRALHVVPLIAQAAGVVQRKHFTKLVFRKIA